MSEFAEVIRKLQSIIASRVDGDTSKSYVAKLYSKGRRKIAQKVGEEAVEVVIAATDNDPKEVIAESADLLFHLLILWEKMGISVDDVANELAGRAGVSGIEEKKNRKKTL